MKLFICSFVFRFASIGVIQNELRDINGSENVARNDSWMQEIVVKIMDLRVISFTSNEQLAINHNELD